MMTALRQELGDPAEPEHGEQQEQAAVASVIAGDQLGGLVARKPVDSTAPPATAASEELGPVEICREVQKRA